MSTTHAMPSPLLFSRLTACPHRAWQTAAASALPRTLGAAQTSAFHSSPVANGRLEALPTRISRKSWEKTQQRNADLRRRLGPKYAEIGRDKRRSPTTTTRSSTQLSQEPPKPAPPASIEAFLATPGTGTVAPVVVGDLAATIAAAKKVVSEVSTGRAKSDSSRSIRGMRRREEGAAEVSRVLAVAPEAVPAAEEIKLKKLKLPEGVAALPRPATTGPGYAYGLTAEEARLLLVDAPKAEIEDSNGVPGTARAEMLRRILSLENANKSQINKFNVDRCVQVFGRTPVDTGSPEVQAAVLSVKISAMREHLATHKKDMSTKRQLEKWVSQRMKMLKYLRRTNLAKFVETCRVIGVEPETIRV
ncbi:ribosomal protein S15 [Geranomyces variabilis]|nr:ribosomal protein S15 [Geranomyces variabilis]